MISIKILNGIQYFLLFIFQNYILRHYLEPKLYFKAFNSYACSTNFTTKRRPK